MCFAKKWGRVGFQDMALLNQALLARQKVGGCYSVQIQYVLGPKAPKAPRNGSLTWPNILEGNSILMKGGLNCRVVSCDKVYIWKNNLLPQSGCRHPLEIYKKGIFL